MTPLELLQQIVGLIKRIPIKQGPIGLQDHAGLARGKFNFSKLELVGLPGEGLQAISELTTLLRKDDPKIERAANSQKVADSIFNFVIELFSDVPGLSITSEHVGKLKARLSDWAAAHGIERLHLVPCFIAPRDCGSFTVGPVHFVHASHFEERRGTWKSKYVDGPDSAYERFLRDMGQSGAHYLAEVQVCGRESERSQELADLTVDLALAGLQLVVPLHNSRRFARMSGRRWSPRRRDIIVSKEGVSTAVAIQSPGLTLGADTFQQNMGRASKLLVSVGNRLEVFLGNRTAKFPELEKAWCDGAYWMREAFAEPIGTIAVAKLETSIEQLMSAGNPSESRARLRSALKGFCGLQPKQPIFAGSSMTVEQFVKNVVEVRSRVLHGTLSTLTQETDELAYAVSILARDHVLKFTLALDRYVSEAVASDDTKSFLKWLETERAWEWAWL